jgi:hypothetical protein
MRWNTWMLAPVAAVLLAGCGGGRNADNAGSTAGGNPETGMQGTATDTGAATATDTTSKMGIGADTGMKADTGAAKTSSDTAKNQSQSGVTKKSGTSTLGPKVTKTRPDQNQPVTSKGDTVSNSADTSASAPK